MIEASSDVETYLRTQERRTLLRRPQPRPVPPRERKIYFWFALLIPVYLLITLVQFLIWFAKILSQFLGSIGLTDPTLNNLISVGAAFAIAATRWAARTACCR